MKNILPSLFVAGCLLAAHACFASGSGVSGPKGSIQPIGLVKRANLPHLAKLSFDEALQAARAACSGSVIKAELEVEDGCLMYSFEIVGPRRKITEVEIDAGNGRVLDIDRGESSDADND